jgi:hypothetical protein
MKTLIYLKSLKIYLLMIKIQIIVIIIMNNKMKKKLMIISLIKMGSFSVAMI